MQPMYYIGLDVHKRKISYCVKEGSAGFTLRVRFRPDVWSWPLDAITARRCRTGQVELFPHHSVGPLIRGHG
jgi:hypothetical protein